MRITWTLIVFTAVVFTGAFARADDLEAGFRAPPNEAQPRVYWWWLNNLVSKEGITRDLEEFKAKGIGGVLLFNAGMPAGPTPSGPDFMSRGWRDTVQHAVREADRLGLEVSINLCSGWDAGGPWITDDTAAHHYAQADLVLKGPQSFSGKLPHPLLLWYGHLPADFRPSRDISSWQHSDLPRPRPRPEPSDSTTERQRPRRRLDRSMARQDHRCRQTDRQPAGDRRREPLAQSSDRRRRTAAGETADENKRNDLQERLPAAALRAAGARRCAGGRVNCGHPRTAVNSQPTTGC